MTTETKAMYTPGPWSEEEGWIVQQGNPGVVIADPRMMNAADADVLGIMEANARLIVQAPAVVELLKVIYEHFDNIGDGAPDASYNARRALSLNAEIEQVLRRAGVEL